MSRNWTEKELAAIIARNKPRVVRPTPEPKQASPVLKKKYWNERKLQQFCVQASLPEPVLEFKFMADRRFRFDLCYPDRMLAIEIQGMCHRIKARFLADIEKRNLAREAGYRVIEVTPKMILSGEAVLLIRRALEQTSTDGQPRK